VGFAAGKENAQSQKGEKEERRGSNGVGGNIYPQSTNHGEGYVKEKLNKKALRAKKTTERRKKELSGTTKSAFL